MLSREKKPGSRTAVRAVCSSSSTGEDWSFADPLHPPRGATLDLVPGLAAGDHTRPDPCLVFLSASPSGRCSSVSLQTATGCCKNLTPTVVLVDATDPHIKWTRQVKASLIRLQYSKYVEDHIRNCLYRPFTRKKLYFDDFWNEERYQQHLIFPILTAEGENCVIVVSDHGHRAPFSVLATNIIPELHLLASTDAFQCFPYYVYTEDGSNRRENITDWALSQFQAKYGSEVTKWDIFHFVYAMMHHPQYRERYAENLKRDLPHIPLLHRKEAFLACVR